MINNIPEYLLIFVRLCLATGVLLLCLKIMVGYGNCR
jgi:hypothetical protein